MLPCLLLPASQNSSYEEFVEGTSENRVSAKFVLTSIKRVGGLALLLAALTLESAVFLGFK
jgi:hypothetical protein